MLFEDVMDLSVSIYPGEHLEAILVELGISERRFADVIEAPTSLIVDIIQGRQAVTAEIALKIGAALRMTPESWLNLQRYCDLDVARASTDISRIQPIVAAD